jgi:hypothetical protein
MDAVFYPQELCNEDNCDKKDLVNNFYPTIPVAVNYTQVLDLYDTEYNLSPRKTNCDSQLQYTDENGTQSSYLTKLCLMGIDTLREKEIGLGTALYLKTRAS